MMDKTKRHWRQHIKHWQESGLSMAAYSRKHKLNKDTLSYYRRKLNHQKPVSPLPESDFLPVVVDSHTAKSRMQLVFTGGVRLEFDEDVSPERLVAVVSLLRRSA